MKSIRISLIAAGLTLALGSTAFAQPGPVAGPGMPQGQPQQMREHMHESMHGRMAERHARHLTELKAKLKLEPGQETAWKTFADAMQPPARSPTRLDRIAMEKLTTPERIDQMLTMHAQRDADMKKRAEATKTFYASLSAEQKKTFDAQTARHMQQYARMHDRGER